MISHVTIHVTTHCCHPLHIPEIMSHYMSPYISPYTCHRTKIAGCRPTLRRVFSLWLKETQIFNRDIWRWHLTVTSCTDQCRQLDILRPVGSIQPFHLFTHLLVLQQSWWTFFVILFLTRFGVKLLCRFSIALARLGVHWLRWQATTSFTMTVISKDNNLL